MKKTTKTIIIALSSVAVLTGVLLLVKFVVPENVGEDTSSASVETVTGEEHIHLISYVPADIKQIDVENETGRYTLLSDTPKTETTASDGTTSYLTDATVYTLVGYEDMELLLGSPDGLAADCAAVTAVKKVNDGSAKADFGFDSPRAVVTVTYQSGEKRTITLGNDADADKGAYIMLDGDENVYLAESDSVDGYLMGAMEMLTTDIGKAATEDSENVFTKMVFGGSLFGEDIVLEYNDNKAYSQSYVITSPDQTMANEETVTYMVNNVRSLTATKVIAVSPEEEKIAEYGLDKPYVTVEAEFPDISVSYKATKPDDEGMFYLLSDGIVYQMDKNAVPWVNYTYDQMIPNTVLNPKYVNTESVIVTAGDEVYEFVVKNDTTTQYNPDDDTDTEIITTTVTCNGKEIDENNYNIFFQNLTSAQRTGTGEIPQGKKEILRVKYVSTEGKESEAVYYEGENRKCPVLINGTLGSTAYESYVSKILEDLPKIAANQTVQSVY